jgi:hypothetical protein
MWLLAIMLSYSESLKNRKKIVETNIYLILVARLGIARIQC